MARQFLPLFVALIIVLAGCSSPEANRTMRTGTSPNSRYTPPGPARPLPGQTAPPVVGESAWQSEATKWIGAPYRWGGESRTGMDCSGLVNTMYANVARIRLPRTSAELARTGTSIPQREQLRPGDILCFDINRSGVVDHVGLFLGGDRFVHASESKGVIYSRLNEPYYVQHYRGARRILR